MHRKLTPKDVKRYKQVIEDMHGCVIRWNLLNAGIKDVPGSAPDPYFYEFSLMKLASDCPDIFKLAKRALNAA